MTSTGKILLPVVPEIVFVVGFFSVRLLLFFLLLFLFFILSAREIWVNPAKSILLFMTI